MTPGGQAANLAVERRVFYRLPIPLPVRYRIVCDRLRTEELYGMTINISAGGLLLQCALPEDSVLDALICGEAVVHLHVDLPGAVGTVHGEARAVWSEGVQGDQGLCRIGLQFLDLQPDAQQRIHDVVVLLSD